MNLHRVVETSMLYHRAHSTWTSPNNATSSIANHIVIYSNLVSSGAFECEINYNIKFELWQNLGEIGKRSFSKAIKRKNGCDTSIALCDALITMS